ncbi:hypothetical protein EYV94_10790 [Puteibacter caeruleilacunae]|nr:hypothetical protein EYV94_10790 [Puteibacter caeruleilacunae]
MSSTAEKQKYFRLSPLHDIDAPVYLEALKEKLNDDRVRNIAITGTYGSGKSSLLETYITQDTDNKDKYLRISLANFCETNEVLEPKDEKKIEEHILQQLFYQLSSKEIPFSGFKKIGHLNEKEQRYLVAAVIVWLFMLIFIPGIVGILNDNLKSIASNGFIGFFRQVVWPSSILNIFILGVFCTGLIFILKRVICLIQKGRLKKVAIKSTQVELSEDSVLNKYIDELIYFFEATNKSVVIIEDLDRFNSVVLFSKLRDVNYLINNSPKVNQVVKFVYAIRDDIFKKNLNRTKFFDFILPIVPVINTTNSGDILLDYLKEEKSIPRNYIQDVSLYIYDLRLLKNVINEYKVYKGVINKNNKQNAVALFSIVLYKNLFPKEFSLEHSGGGLLSRIFSEGKNQIISRMKEGGNEQIQRLEVKKQEIEKETSISEVKLREEYVLQIFKTYQDIRNICESSVEDIINKPEVFGLLLKNPTIRQRDPNYRGTDVRELDFTNIQRQVNTEYTYEERLLLIQQREDGRLSEINKEIRQYSFLNELLKRTKLADLVKRFNDIGWKLILLETKEGRRMDEKKFSQRQELLALLIRKGYINEDYQLYMSYFYEGSLSLSDYEYLLNVKNGDGDTFNTELSNIQELISRISDDEYKYEVALNKWIIRKMLGSSDYAQNRRLSFLFEQFKEIDSAFEKYIMPLVEFLKEDATELKRFFELLIDYYYPDFWDAIEEQSFTDLEKDKYLRLLLCLSKDKLKALDSWSGDNLLNGYLRDKENFIQVFDYPKDLQGIVNLIEGVNIKFRNLEVKQYSEKQILNYIYKKNYYVLNEKMVYLMILNFGKYDPEALSQLFYTKNLTCIFESECKELVQYLKNNLDEYVDVVYPKLRKEQDESVVIIKFILDKYGKEGDFARIVEILEKVSTQISDIRSFGHEDDWNVLFETNNVEPNWRNLVYYFKYNENKLDDVTTEWLKRKDVYENITTVKLRKENFAKEKLGLISSLMQQIIEMNELELKMYMKFLTAFPYIFHQIDLTKLSSDKISQLVRLRKISYRRNHYDQLVECGLIDQLLTFTLSNFSTFNNSNSDFDFNVDLHIRLLASGKLDTSEQRELIRLVSIDNINDSKLAELMGDILQRSKKAFIDKDKLAKIISVSENKEKKLKLLNKFIKEFGFKEVDLILDSMGGVYRKATMLQHHPKWVKNKLNLSIAEKLNEVDYFSSIDTTDKEEIKINVRYQ